MALTGGGRLLGRGGRACGGGGGAGRPPTAPSWAGWAEIGFPFSFEFRIPFFYFLYGMEFNSNQTTIQIQIFQACA
jgi:hypothetical protein